MPQHCACCEGHEKQIIVEKTELAKRPVSNYSSAYGSGPVTPTHLQVSYIEY